MVGLIPKILFQLIEETAGLETAVEIKRRAGIPPERTYELNTVYSDDEWQRSLAITCDVLGLSVEQAEEAYADVFFRDALKRWPVWFEMSSNSREFLQRQPAIHNTMASGLQDPSDRRAVTDKFRVETHDGELVVHYHSPNQHCSLYKSLARWIIGHYGDRATIDEPRCLKRGDQECEIHVRWERIGEGP